jgi:hypothetical protein
MCKLPKIWAHQNYCHLKPRCIKYAGDHLTTQCHHKERSSDVRCVLYGGNHPANYKGCTIYKELQKNIPTTSSETIYSSYTNKKIPYILNQELHMPK